MLRQRDQQYLQEKNRVDAYEELVEHVKMNINQIKLRGKGKKAYVQRISIIHESIIRPVDTIQGFISKVLSS